MSHICYRVYIKLYCLRISYLSYSSTAFQLWAFWFSLFIIVLGDISILFDLQFPEHQEWCTLLFLASFFSYIVDFVLGSHQLVLRKYCWFCAQGSLLVKLRELHMVLESVTDKKINLCTIYMDSTPPIFEWIVVHLLLKFVWLIFLKLHLGHLNKIIFLIILKVELHLFINILYTYISVLQIYYAFRLTPVLHITMLIDTSVF